MLKNDGTIRICGEYKQTINQVAIPDKYSLPKVDDLLASLAGGEPFTKLDLAHAYQKLVLDEESSKLATVNTHRGLFRYKRLPFGISTGPLFFKGLWRAYCKVFPKFVFTLMMCWLQATQRRSTWPTDGSVTPDGFRSNAFEEREMFFHDVSGTLLRTHSLQKRYSGYTGQSQSVS